MTVAAPSWFRALTGFDELTYAETQQRLQVAGGRLFSTVNGRSYAVGTLEMPSLADLRGRAAAVTSARPPGKLRTSVVVGDVGVMHREPANRDALFQVASQFNLLEMVHPAITPEHGVTRYADDRTQGPACAIAAGAATIYRNYFAPIGDQIGQTSARQIDCLADLGIELGNQNGELWAMQNGYALCSQDGLRRIAKHLDACDADELDRMRGLLRVGIHSGVEVTRGAGEGQSVSQIFCSALPVSYTDVPAPLWEPFARLVLESAYESTLHAAVLNASRAGSNIVFLTQLGGGAFGNPTPWIHDAMRRALHIVKAADLDVRVVSYGRADEQLLRLVEECDN